jgi:hypothetical protein
MTTRRDFLRHAVAGGSGTLAAARLLAAQNNETGSENTPIQFPPISKAHAAKALNLSPASWIWFPSERTLPNTFILFRKSITLPDAPVRAAGWITADSRYSLSVNGKRLQGGPAPSDPRYLETDPVDCAHLLHPGENTIGVTVLFYGHGDGTSPLGKPGLIMLMTVECTDGSRRTVYTDDTWQSCLATAWRPGQYKRWYLRALQEVFDARKFPYGWDTDHHQTTGDWVPAMKLKCAPDKPPLCSDYPDYLYETTAPTDTCTLLARSIPLLQEPAITGPRLRFAHRILWNRPAEEYFDTLAPGAYGAEQLATPHKGSHGEYTLEFKSSDSIGLTYEFDEEIVGYPFFSINAPAGTVVELLVHEAHAENGPALLNTHFNAWSRFICRGGGETFETFDYEAVKWIQLLIRETSGTINVSNIGVRRRLYPWTHRPAVRTSDPKLNKLIDASVNTLMNSAQETVVDGVGRERQQYSGDGGHQLHGIYLAFGDSPLPARFIRTFSQGITLEGYFLDCWPAYDRLARVMERQLGLTPWGPILDHSIGFAFDCHYYYLYTGDLEPLREAYPRLQRFVKYLKQIQSESTGLLPVENLGIPSVWMDHNAYLPRHQHHKQCAFNLYAAAMLERAFPILANAFGDRAWARQSRDFAKDILRNTQRTFWDPTRQLFVINRPWLSEEHEARLCDRSLATAVLFDQCPSKRTQQSIDALASLPPEMGLSYPANAGWRLWALAHGRRIDVVLNEFRERWWAMQSVHHNNTLQESWTALPDSGDLWSHCPIAPLYVTYMGIAGIQPLNAGWKTVLLHPQPGDLTEIEATVPTPRGPVTMSISGAPGERQMTIILPGESEGHLLLDTREKIPGLVAARSPIPKTALYLMPGGKESTFTLRYT